MGGASPRAAATGRYTIGVDVGGTKVLAVALDPAHPGEPLGVELVPTPGGPSRLASVVLSAVGALRARLGQRHLGGVGVGIAGLLDLDGVLRVAPNLGGGGDFDVAGALAPQLDVPVVVDNDANCACAAELAAGAARGCGEVVYVALGTGIGGAVVNGGEVQRGAHGFAGEPGHMTVVPGGWACACGRAGCWEAYASGTALGRHGREAAAEGRAGGLLARAGGDPAAIRGEDVTAAAVDGDAEAIAVLERFGWWVALGLANLVNLLDPERVVLGGTMIEVGELLVAPVRVAFAERVLAGPERDGPPVVAASFGARSAAVGAALLAGRAMPAEVAAVEGR